MRIKNWREFQHYKDRDPLWIKLYVRLLNDDEWFHLDPKHAKVLVMLWCLASEDPERLGTLPSIKKIAFRLRMTESAIESTISNLSHWLEQDASDSLAKLEQSASLEKRRDRDREEETPQRADDETWWEDLRKNPAYQHINFEIERGKMQAWFSIPKNSHRKPTKQFVVNWLNKIERPMTIASSNRPTKVAL